MKVIDFISLLCFALALVLGLVLTLINFKSKRKVWISLAISFLIASIALQVFSLLEKKAQRKEDLIIKYNNILNDQKILGELRTMAMEFDNGVSMVKLSPTAKTYGKAATITFIKIPSPMGLVGMYKVIDPSEYGLQNITPLMPVLFEGKVYYIGAIAVSKEKYNKSNTITVISKHNNGLIDIENLIIEDIAFNIKTFSHFAPLILTNRERLLLIKAAGQSANLPPVTKFDEYTGIVEFGPYGKPEKAPSVQFRLKNDGGVDANFVSIPDPIIQKFKTIFSQKLNQSPTASIKEIQDKP